MWLNIITGSVNYHTGVNAIQDLIMVVCIGHAMESEILVDVYEIAILTINNTCKSIARLRLSSHLGSSSEMGRSTCRRDYMNTLEHYMM